MKSTQSRVFSPTYHIMMWKTHGFPFGKWPRNGELTKTWPDPVRLRPQRHGVRSQGTESPLFMPTNSNSPPINHQQIYINYSQKSNTNAMNHHENIINPALTYFKHLPHIPASAAPRAWQPWNSKISSLLAWAMAWMYRCQCARHFIFKIRWFPVPKWNVELQKSVKLDIFE